MRTVRQFRIFRTVPACQPSLAVGGLFCGSMMSPVSACAAGTISYKPESHHHKSDSRLVIHVSSFALT